MLVSLLDVKYNVASVKKLSQAIHYSCDYLDFENGINNMCDFQNNRCIAFREKGKEGTTGCCPSFCRHTKSQVCKVKNLGCKIFMCNYLENRGYFFSVHHIPLLRLLLNPLERFCLAGYLFRPTKKTISYTWFIRGICFAYLAVFIFALVMILI